MINLTSKSKIRFYVSENSNKQAQRIEKFSKIQRKKLRLFVPFSSKKRREKRYQMHDAAATFGAKTLVIFREKNAKSFHHILIHCN